MTISWIDVIFKSKLISAWVNLAISVYLWNPTWEAAKEPCDALVTIIYFLPSDILEWVDALTEMNAGQ